MKKQSGIGIFQPNFLLAVKIVSAFIILWVILIIFGYGKDEKITPSDIDNQTRQRVQNIENRKKLGWQMQKEVVEIINTNNCPRCGTSHNIEVYKLTKPSTMGSIFYDRFAICKNTNEPILLARSNNPRKMNGYFLSGPIS